MLKRGPGCRTSRRTPFPACAIFPSLRSDRFPLTKPNTFPHNRGASDATLRWCSGSPRNTVRFPSGGSVQLHRNLHPLRVSGCRWRGLCGSKRRGETGEAGAGEAGHRDRREAKPPAPGPARAPAWLSPKFFTRRDGRLSPPRSQSSSHGRCPHPHACACCPPPPWRAAAPSCISLRPDPRQTLRRVARIHRYG